jgi:hypothetical protein
LVTSYCFSSCFLKIKYNKTIRAQLPEKRIVKSDPELNMISEKQLILSFILVLLSNKNSNVLKRKASSIPERTNPIFPKLA